MPNPVDVIVELGGETVEAGRLWAHRRGQDVRWANLQMMLAAQEAAE